MGSFLANAKNDINKKYDKNYQEIFFDNIGKDSSHFKII
jgi:hypothetical protein